MALKPETTELLKRYQSRIDHMKSLKDDNQALKSHLKETLQANQTAKRRISELEALLKQVPQLGPNIAVNECLIAKTKLDLMIEQRKKDDEGYKRLQLLLSQSHSNFSASYSLWAQLSNQLLAPLDRGKETNIYPDEYRGFITITNTESFGRSTFWISLCTNLKDSIKLIKSIFKTSATVVFGFPLKDPLSGIELLKDLIYSHKELVGILSADMMDMKLVKRPISLFTLPLNTILEDVSIVLNLEQHNIPSSLVEDSANAFCQTKEVEKDSIPDPKRLKTTKEKELIKMLPMDLMKSFVEEECTLDPEFIQNRLSISQLCQAVKSWTETKDVENPSKEDIISGMTQFKGLYYESMKQEYFGISLKGHDCRIRLGNKILVV